MTGSVSAVAGWRPGELAAAADQLDERAAALDDDARVVRRHLVGALDEAGGAWAAAATDRADREVRRGLELADACSSAAVVLRAGADALAGARDRLLTTVAAARSAGFAVSDDGSVTAPPAPDPPADVPPAERLAWGVAPERLAEAALVEQQRAALAAEVAAGLALVAEVDDAVADALVRVDVPLTAASAVDAQLARARLLDGDQVAALGTAGGVVVAGRTLHAATSTASDVRRLGHYAGLARQGASAEVLDDARRALAFGTSTHPVLKLAGRANLPLTAISGVGDLVDGGGYDGARGWATRGFGAAGAAGAAALMIGGAPAVVVVGGAAVIAYGVWSAGNYAVDHWDQVEDAWEATGDWVDERGAEVGEAVDWAHDQLADAADGFARLGWSW